MLIRLRAELAPKEPVSRSEVEKQGSFSIYRIRLWIEGMPPHTRSVEYSLHPEYKGITRRANRGLADGTHPFSTYVFTRDDYWVEAKLSMGAAVQGTWLTEQVAQGPISQPDRVSFLAFFTTARVRALWRERSRGKGRGQRNDARSHCTAA